MTRETNRSLRPPTHTRIAIEWALVGILGMILGLGVGLIALVMAAAGR